MSLAVDSTNRIQINGRDAGLSVCQESHATVVYRPENLLRGVAYKVFEMPHLRYSLSADKPASGVPGRIEFERDVRSLIATGLTWADGLLPVRAVCGSPFGRYRIPPMWP